MHCSICFLENKTTFYASFVYAFIEVEDRRPLWNDLSHFAGVIDSPWILAGNFKAIISLEENYGGLGEWNRVMIEVRDILLQLGLVDLRSIGENFMWWNKNPEEPIYKKLDRILVNAHWISTFANAMAVFLPRRLSNHSLGVIESGIQVPSRKKPFQYFIFLSGVPHFADEISEVWRSSMIGNPWFIPMSKLKRVKQVLNFRIIMLG